MNKLLNGIHTINRTMNFDTIHLCQIDHLLYHACLAETSRPYRQVLSYEVHKMEWDRVFRLPNEHQSAMLHKNALGPFKRGNSIGRDQCCIPPLLHLEIFGDFFKAKSLLFSSGFKIRSSLKRSGNELTRSMGGCLVSTATTLEPIVFADCTPRWPSPPNPKIARIEPSGCPARRILL